MINKQDFVSLAWIRGEWDLTVDGKSRARGKLPKLSAGPGRVEAVSLKLPALLLEAGQEAFLNLRFYAAAATAWCPAGFELGWDQIAVAASSRVTPKRAAVTKAPALECSEKGDLLIISSDDLRLTTSKAGGHIESLDWQGHPIFLSGPRLQIWRAPTDNDGIKGWSGQENKPLGRWLAAGLDKMTLRGVQTDVRQKPDGSVVLTSTHLAACAASAEAVRHEQIYTIHSSGIIRVQNTFVVDPFVTDLPRLGVGMVLPPSFEKISWLGRGPLENYIDRQRGALVGLYSSTVTEQYVPYIMPQEHGNHTDVRRLTLEGSPVRLTVHAEKGPLEFSASHFTAGDLFAALHTYELKPRPEVMLNLDFQQRGLGTGSCGPDTLEKYRIIPGRYRWDYVLQLTGRSPA